MRSSMGLQRTDHTIDAQQGYSTRADGMALQWQALQTLADTHAHTKWARASPSHAHSISIVSKDSAVAQATPQTAQPRRKAVQVCKQVRNI
jgi:hypothetical protein